MSICCVSSDMLASLLCYIPFGAFLLLGGGSLRLLVLFCWSNWSNWWDWSNWSDWANRADRSDSDIMGILRRCDGEVSVRFQ